ncbi:hypothetical protein HG530_014615 [Fusarium avenaceum]|nr:hypothetical protein HG530_014615 [Fusarium avenaceum]
MSSSSILPGIAVPRPRCGHEDDVVLAVADRIQIQQIVICEDFFGFSFDVGLDRNNLVRQWPAAASLAWIWMEGRPCHSLPAGDNVVRRLGG